MTESEEEAEQEAGQEEAGHPGPGHRAAAPRHDDHRGSHGGPVPLRQDDVLSRPQGGAGQEGRPPRLEHVLVLVILVSTSLAVFIIFYVVPDLSSRPGALSDAVLVIITLGLPVSAAVVARVVGVF